MNDKTDRTQASGSNPARLDDATIAYLNELAAEIVACGNPAGELWTEMKAAHERRRRFALEMAAGTSDRAQQVRQILAATVYGTVTARGAIRTHS